MRRTRAQVIHEAEDLIGFWSFSLEGRDYVGVVEDEGKEDVDGVLLSVFGRTQEGWSARRKVTIETVAHAVDGHLAGPDLFLCIEVNRMRPLQVERWSAAELLDPAVKTPSPTPAGAPALSDEQLRQISLPPAAWWNVLDLKPAEWLFRPRFVEGVTAVQIVADTADGHAVLLSDLQPKRRGLLQLDSPAGPKGARPDAGTAGTAPAGSTGAGQPFAAADAFLPQALVFQGRTYLAYRGVPPPVHPFWLLHDGKSAEPAVPLMMKEGDAAPRDLSAELGIGKIGSFSLVAGPGGAPWIFAVREAAVGSEVVALAFDGARWNIKGKLPVDEVIQELRVGGTPPSWLLLYSSSVDKKWSLRAHAWRL